jgi:hypothetical protein
METWPQVAHATRQLLRRFVPGFGDGVDSPNLSDFAEFPAPGEGDSPELSLGAGGIRSWVGILGWVGAGLAVAAPLWIWDWRLTLAVGAGLGVMLGADRLRQWPLDRQLGPWFSSLTQPQKFLILAVGGGTIATLNTYWLATLWSETHSASLTLGLLGQSLGLWLCGIAWIAYGFPEPEAPSPWEHSGEILEPEPDPWDWSWPDLLQGLGHPQPLQRWLALHHLGQYLSQSLSPYPQPHQEQYPGESEGKQQDRYQHQYQEDHGRSLGQYQGQPLGEHLGGWVLSEGLSERQIWELSQVLALLQEQESDPRVRSILLEVLALLPHELP